MNHPIRPLGMLFLVLILSAMACALPGAIGDLAASADQLPGTLTALAPTQDAEMPDAAAVPGDSLTTGGTCANPLQPVALNATWTYRFGDGDEDIRDDLTYTNTITETREDGFTAVAPIAGFTRTQRWACKAEGLLLMDVPGGGTTSLAGSGLNLELRTTSNEGVTLPAHVAEGDEWSSLIAMEGKGEINGSAITAHTLANYRFRAEGLEEVTVPAGTFLARKITFTASLATTMTMNGVDVPTTVVLTGSAWYAPGVGAVRSEARTEIGGVVQVSVEELIAYDLRL